MLWCLIAGILQPVTWDLCMTPVMLNPPSIQGSPWPPPWLNVCKEASGKCRNDPRSSISRTVEWSHRGYLALGFMRTGSPAELLRTRKETSVCSAVDLQLLKDHATFVIFQPFTQ